MKICGILTVLTVLWSAVWRPSGLSSSVILSSAFSSLVLPSTWQGFLLHSWLYNLSLCLSPSLTLSCVCTLQHVCVCVCVFAGIFACVVVYLTQGVCKPMIYGPFWQGLSNYYSFFTAVCQQYKDIWPTDKTLEHHFTRNYRAEYIPVYVNAGVYMCSSVYVVTLSYEEDNVNPCGL